MKIYVNGSERDVDSALDVHALVESETSRSTGVAVAVDGDVVARSQWATTNVADGAVVEIVTAVQGG